MGPTWVLSSPGGPHVGPLNFAIWDILLPSQVMCLSGKPGARGSSRPCVRSWISVITTQRLWTSWHMSTTVWPTSLRRLPRLEEAKSKYPASWVYSPRRCTSRRSECCHAWWHWLWLCIEEVVLKVNLSRGKRLIIQLSLTWALRVPQFD